MVELLLGLFNLGEICVIRLLREVMCLKINLMREVFVDDDDVLFESDDSRIISVIGENFEG